MLGVFFGAGEAVRLELGALVLASRISVVIVAIMLIQ